MAPRRGVAARGFGNLEDTGIDSVDSFFVHALKSVEDLATLAELAAGAQSAPDLAAIAKNAEAARDADLAAVRSFTRGFATTAGSVAGAVALFGGPAGLALGVVIAGIGAAVGLAGEIGTWVWDLFDGDDGKDVQEAVKNELAWFASHAWPFPEFNEHRHESLGAYREELTRSRESLERMPPDDLREALFRCSALFRAAVAESDPIVLAALLVGGEGGRSWTYSGPIAGEDRGKVGRASNADAVKLLVTAIGTTTAQSLALPVTHWQAVIDAAIAGWESGVKRGQDTAYEHRGSVGMGTAQLYAEAAAAEIRATLDAVEAAYPGAVAAIFPASARRAEELGSTLDRFGSLLSPRARAAQADAMTARGVPDEIVDKLRPPPPAKPEAEAGAVSAPVVLGLGAATVGVGWFLLKSAAGAAFRRALGL